MLAWFLSCSLQTVELLFERARLSVRSALRHQTRGVWWEKASKLHTPYSRVSSVGFPSFPDTFLTFQRLSPMGNYVGRDLSNLTICRVFSSHIRYVQRGEQCLELKVVNFPRKNEKAYFVYCNNILYPCLAHTLESPFCLSCAQIIYYSSSPFPPPPPPPSTQ